MVKLLFICHGNICRSPMAEFVFKDMLQNQNLAHQVLVASAATSTDEIGNPPHRGTRAKLAEHGITDLGSKVAVQLTPADYSKYDYLIAMDAFNIRNMRPFVGNDPEGKVHRLLDFATPTGDIADPWYTGDFNLTYTDVVRGCEGLLAHLRQTGAV